MRKAGVSKAVTVARDFAKQCRPFRLHKAISKKLCKFSMYKKKEKIFLVLRVSALMVLYFYPLK